MDTAQNRLIEMLPRKDRLRLLASCESVQLKLGEVLCDAGQVVQHAYFPVNGFISLLARIEDHPSLEVGMLGREGMYGAALLLGVAEAPVQALVQGSGTAWRMAAADLRAEVECNAPLRHNLLRYLFVTMEQMATSAACLRFHLIGPRLARWLLMSEDRAHASQFRVTHEFLACMLGVRRVGVTVAAGELQRRGLISYHRGEVKVLDRNGLEAASCSCYMRQRLAYEAQWPANLPVEGSSLSTAVALTGAGKFGDRKHGARTADKSKPDGCAPDDLTAETCQQLPALNSSAS